MTNSEIINVINTEFAACHAWEDGKAVTVRYRGKAKDLISIEHEEVTYSGNTETIALAIANHFNFTFISND